MTDHTASANVTVDEQTFPIPIERARVVVPTLVSERLGGLTRTGDAEFSATLTSDDGWPRLVSIRLAEDGSDTRLSVRVETLRVPINRFTLLGIAQLLVTFGVYGFFGNTYTLVMLALAAVCGVAGFIEREKLRDRSEREVRERRAVVHGILAAMKRAADSSMLAHGYRIDVVEQARARDVEPLGIAHPSQDEILTRSVA